MTTGLYEYRSKSVNVAIGGESDIEPPAGDGWEFIRSDIVASTAAQNVPHPGFRANNGSYVNEYAHTCISYCYSIISVWRRLRPPPPIPSDTPDTPLLTEEQLKTLEVM